MDSRSRRAGFRRAALVKRRVRADLGARLLQAAASMNRRHYVGHPYPANALNMPSVAFWFVTAGRSDGE
jgi:hypothetical protein